MTHCKEFVVKNRLNSTAQGSMDAELVRRALEGNEGAFTALFDAHRPKVYSLCLRMTSNADEADDLTQEAFLQVFRKLGTFRGESALSTWLYRVAVNTVLKYFRKKGPRHASLEESANTEARTPMSGYGKADDRLMASVDRIALIRAMKELAVGYRTIFLMHEVRGYEHHEIASLLCCSVGTSKSQLHTAKARMREFLGIKKADRYGTAKQQPAAAYREPARKSVAC
jgi:RNA polymerase sigma-70 factor (ECF subfamily)